MRQHGLLHYGQGKWYPGEQLPRWSLNVFWRARWRTAVVESRLLPPRAEVLRRDRRAGAGLPAKVAERLGIDAEHQFPAYEDVWYYLWRERRLPANVDPFDSRLDDPLERERLRAVFSQRLDRSSAMCCRLRSPCRVRAGRPARGSCAMNAAI